MIKNKSILKEDPYTYFYHATTPEALPEIVKYGLLPSSKTHWGGDLGKRSEGKIFVTNRFRRSNYYGNIIWRNEPNRYRPILRFKYNKLRFIPDKQSSDDFYIEYPIKAKFEIFVYNEDTKINQDPRNGDLWFTEKTGEWRPLTPEIADAIYWGEWDGEEITDDKILNETINKVGYHTDEEYSDMPIDWNAWDLQIDGKWNEQSIKTFMGLPPTFTAIYKAIVEVSDLTPNPPGAGDWENYDWDEFRRVKRGFPPIVIVRTTTGKLKIVDGNHRVYWAEQKDYKTIGAWVVDYLIQKDINRRNNRKNLQETRIITLPESLYEGYVTLYHGTIWPVALKAKKGELGPQNLEKLVIDVLVNVFHETPQRAKEYYDKYSGFRAKDPPVLYFTTSKENAEGYAKSNTKYGGEIFSDVLSGYMWSKHKRMDRHKLSQKLKTNEPAVVTINVPLHMVFTHPHWNTPIRDRIRKILDPREKKEMCKSVWEDLVQGNLRMEVFVKEKIPSRFVQRIDKVIPNSID